MHLTSHAIAVLIKRLNTLLLVQKHNCVQVLSVVCSTFVIFLLYQGGGGIGLPTHPFPRFPPYIPP